MKFGRKASAMAVTLAAVMIQSGLPTSVLAEANQLPTTQWSVQVNQVDAGGVNVGPEFKVAIYENLLEELVKTKHFSAVLRSGDRTANDVPKLLILKTTIESYSPGSEAKRAVTTVAGATKLKVRSQLSTREGQVVLERVVDGNVRFLGGNLRATHNLAKNVAKAIKQSTVPEPASTVHER